MELGRSRDSRVGVLNYHLLLSFAGDEASFCFTRKKKRKWKYKELT